MNKNELYQFNEQKGQNLKSKCFLSATTSKLTAKDFCGNDSNIKEGLKRVIFLIHIDLDFTNDTGTYIKF